MNPVNPHWHTLWNKKGVQARQQPSLGLADLIAADGFDSGPGDFTVDSWRRFVQRIITHVGLKKADQCLEVGCGSGAFLWPLEQLGCAITGVDYSHS